jgi:tryptophanyl-tRNA synthetase
MSVVTDSAPLEAPKDPEANTVFQIYRLVAEPAAVAEMASRLGAGGYGYGDAKKALLGAIEEVFGPARDRRAALAADPDGVADVLATGAARARTEAGAVLAAAREAVGMSGSPVGTS